MNKNDQVIGSGYASISKRDPCMGCDKIKLCCHEKIACHAMRIWMASNKNDTSKPKVPCRKYYKQIYGDK